MWEGQSVSGLTGLLAEDPNLAHVVVGDCDTIGESGGGAKDGVCGAERRNAAAKPAPSEIHGEKPAGRGQNLRAVSNVDKFTVSDGAVLHVVGEHDGVTARLIERTVCDIHSC